MNDVLCMMFDMYEPIKPLGALAHPENFEPLTCKIRNKPSLRLV